MAMKRVNIISNSFQEYAVCPQCKSVYTQQECIKCCGSVRKAKQCKKKLGRAICNSDILQTKHMPNGRVVFSPYQTYCYNSISSLIARKVAMIPSLLKDCEAWRDKIQSPMDNAALRYFDVYDGALWRESFANHSFKHPTVWFYNQMWIGFNHIIIYSTLLEPCT